jgi:hypothetical protein
MIESFKKSMKSNNSTNDIPKYKKKAKKQPRKKTDHKHIYKPCIIRNPIRSDIYEYCTICGKVIVPRTEDGATPNTSLIDLPVFKTNVYFVKYVDLEDI